MEAALIKTLVDAGPVGLISAAFIYLVWKHNTQMKSKEQEPNFVTKDQLDLSLARLELRIKEIVRQELDN